MIRLPFTLLLLLLVSSPQAAELAGRSVASIGEVALEREGLRRPLQVNEALLVGDTLHTGRDSQVKLLLEDEAVVRLGAESQLTLSALAATAPEHPTRLDLARGRLRAFVSHAPAAHAAERFEVRTPSAIAGVRGTDFEVLTVNPTFVRVFYGSVMVRPLGGGPGLLLLPNQYVRVDSERGTGEAHPIDPGTPLEGPIQGEEGVPSGLRGPAPEALDLAQLRVLLAVSGGMLALPRDEPFRYRGQGPGRAALSRWLREREAQAQSDQLDQLDRPLPADAIPLPIRVEVPLP